MAPKFEMPGFVQPVQPFADLPSTLDQIFNSYQQAKLVEEQRSRQKMMDQRQLDMDKRNQQRQSVEDYMKFGFDVSQVKPEMMGRQPLIGPPSPGREQEWSVESAMNRYIENKRQMEGANLEQIRSKSALEQAQAIKALREPDISPDLAYRMGKDAEKRELDIKELQIPGYELGSDVRPTTKEAQDLRTGSGAMKDFISGVDRMSELIKRHGSTNLMGEASGEMQTLASNLKLTLKEVQKLGVLSASDIAFLDAQVFDPTSLKSVFTRTPTALRQLETIKQRAVSAFNEGLKARGYSSKGQQGQGDIAARARQILEQRRRGKR